MNSSPMSELLLEEGVTKLVRNFDTSKPIPRDTTSLIRLYLLVLPRESMKLEANCQIYEPMGEHFYPNHHAYLYKFIMTTVSM